MPFSESEFWKGIAQWLWGILLLPLLALWRAFNARIEKVETAVHEKADLKDMTEEFLGIYKRQDKMFEKLDRHAEEDRERFDKIIAELGNVQGKLDMLVRREDRKP